MDFLPYLSQLGLPGIAFVVFMFLAQLGLTQFCKVILKESFSKFGGIAVMLLSVLIGGLLGWVMLTRVAGLLDITAPEPWGGIIAGMLLGAIVAGMVNYLEERAKERAGHQADVTAQAISAALTQVVQPQQSTAQGQTYDGPVTIPAEPTPLEELRPITPEEAAAMTRTDWPAPAWGEDAPLDRGP